MFRWQPRDAVDMLPPSGGSALSEGGAVAWERMYQRGPRVRDLRYLFDWIARHLQWRLLAGQRHRRQLSPRLEPKRRRGRVSPARSESNPRLSETSQVPTRTALHFDAK